MSGGAHGVPEDALMIEAFHDGGSGKLYLEATPAEQGVEPCMMQMEVLGYMRELARQVLLPANMGAPRAEATLAGQLKAMQARVCACVCLCLCLCICVCLSWRLCRRVLA